MGGWGEEQCRDGKLRKRQDNEGCVGEGLGTRRGQPELWALLSRHDPEGPLRGHDWVQAHAAAVLERALQWQTGLVLAVEMEGSRQKSPGSEDR